MTPPIEQRHLDAADMMLAPPRIHSTTMEREILAVTFARFEESLRRKDAEIAGLLETLAEMVEDCEKWHGCSLDATADEARARARELRGEPTTGGGR